MSGHPANMENVRNAYNILGIQHEMKRPFGKAMHKWRKNIKKVFKEIKRMDWIQLVQDRFQWWDLMNMVIKLLSSIKLGNFLIKWVFISFSHWHHSIKQLTPMSNETCPKVKLGGFNVFLCWLQIWNPFSDITKTFRGTGTFRVDSAWGWQVCGSSQADNPKQKAYSTVSVTTLSGF